MYDILIADDDQKWRELAEETFWIAGYTCDFALDGKEAIDKLEKEQYKLVCINWKLKDYQHGRTLLRRLHSQFSDIPVILTTGYPILTAGSWDETSKKFSEDIEALRKRYSNLKKIIIKGSSDADGRDFVDILLDEVQYLISGNEDGMSNFDVFLCHNSEDKPMIKEIAERLKNEKVIPWLDEWELQPGKSWQRLLEEQIGTIKSAAVFVGSSGIGPWQRNELDAFLREFTKRGIPVIPVLLDDAPTKPELPIFLNAMTWIDFRKSDPDPIKQLVWGITGKKP